MSRRDNAHVRCPRCHLHLSLCLCAEIPRLCTRTRLVLVIHRLEVRKTTNTGRLATECLQNSEMWVRGGVGCSLAERTVVPASLPLLLFPEGGALPLAAFRDSALPVTLFVPDGTWKQASKMRHRVPALAKAQRVNLPDGPPSQYRLRREERPGGLATLEAIARALGLLEGPAVQEALERVFLMWVDRTRWSRGELPAERVRGGIPKGALRHDPLSGLGQDTRARCL